MGRCSGHIDRCAGANGGLVHADPSRAMRRFDCTRMGPNDHLEGFRLGDDITRCGFELTLGVGQASRRMVLDLTASLSGYPSAIAPGPTSGAILPVAWECQPWGSGYSDGTVTLPWCLPAVALAGRFVLGVVGGGPNIATSGGPVIESPAVGAPILTHRISGSVWAAVCPRSL